MRQVPEPLERPRGPGDSQGWEVLRPGRLVTIVAALCVAACAAVRDRHDVPDVALPAQYKNASAAPADAVPGSEAGVTRAPARPPAPEDPLAEARLAEWWRAFGNAELEGLINRGQANNPDVRIATIRIVQAKTRVDQAAAGLLPSVGAPIQIANQETRSGVGNVNNLPDSNSGSSGSQHSYQASLKADWRVDLWGEQHSLLKAAKLRLWQATFERDNAQRNMTGNVAYSYVEYLSLNDRLRVARETEAVLASLLTSVEGRLKSGDATRIEFEQQRAAIYALRATIPGLEQQREDALNTIAFLVGAVPGSLVLTAGGLDSFAVPAAVPGVPSALLLRRPDVRMAEARLLAADADVDVARARILPPLDLTAQAGYGSLVLSKLFQAQSFFWNAIASVTASVFDGGKRNADKEYAQAVHEEMVESYARTIYQAVREVEGALSAVTQTTRRLAAQQEATDAARRAWDISRDVYAVGGIDYQTLLDTERSFHRNLDERQRISMERYQAYIALFHALGGGATKAERLPGEGERPSPPVEPGGGVIAVAAPKERQLVQGVDWAGQGTGGDAWTVENFWQVELPGVYDRSTIGATWRDLRARFPKQMENRFLRPRLKGRIDDSSDGQVSWYRLYVAKFDSAAAAADFCAALRSSYQRCRVVSSRPGEPDTPLEAAAEAATAGAVAAETAAGAEAPPPPAAAPSTAPVAAVASAAPAPMAPMPPAKAPVEARQTPPAGRPEPPTAYAIQIGAFASHEQAAQAFAHWQDKGYPVYGWQLDDRGGRPLYAVRIGGYERQREASAMAARFARQEKVRVAVVASGAAKHGRRYPLDINDLLAMKPPATAPAAVPAATRRAAYTLQFGAFASAENAALASASWQARGYAVYVAMIAGGDGRSIYAVRSGAYARRQDAAAAAARIGRKEQVPVLPVPAILDAGGSPLAVDGASLVRVKN